jgi:hypothetical protein
MYPNTRTVTGVLTVASGQKALQTICVSGKLSLKGLMLLELALKKK